MEKYHLTYDEVMEIPQPVLDAMLTKNQVESMHSRSQESRSEGSASNGD